MRVIMASVIIHDGKRGDIEPIDILQVCVPSDKARGIAVEISTLIRAYLDKNNCVEVHFEAPRC